MGANTEHSTTLSWPRSSLLHSFVATSHTRDVYWEGLCGHVNKSSPVQEVALSTKKKMKRAWSLEELTRSFPSSLGCTYRTHSKWPVIVFTQYLSVYTDKRGQFRYFFKTVKTKKRDPYPVASSQSLMVLSREADAIISPEGRKVTDETLWSWPKSVLMHL